MTPYYQDDYVTLYHGDCRNVLPELPEASSDLVFTDPPYPREFDWCWGVLATEMPRLMKPNTLLFTLCGHYQLPLVLSALGSQLTWFWLFIQRNHSSPVIWNQKLRAAFKPLCAFVKGAPGNVVHHQPGMMADDVSIAGTVANSKAFHSWGQPAVLEPVLRFCPPGGTLIDPFCGGGTNLRVAKDVGRRAIGIEIDERHVETAARRCSQEVLQFGSTECAAPPA